MRRKKKKNIIEKKFENRWKNWIFGFLPFTSTRYTQNTGFQRTFVIFDLSKFSKITHFWFFKHEKKPNHGISEVFEGFYMTSLISRQSAVGEITYISGIV